jgi:ABC-2 type transport system ATP-binding protein
LPVVERDEQIFSALSFSPLYDLMLASLTGYLLRKAVRSPGISLMNAVQIDQITKRYDSHEAVSGLTFAIEQGSVYGLLGPNGAGKTTTLRMILRILIPDEGSVQVLGNPVSERTQDLIGYLPEERGIYPKMKVLDALVFLGALKGLTEAEARKRSSGWLERLELSSWAGKKVNDLSKGMQQKIQFIGAVQHRPPVLILDEPFSGLDPVNAALIKDIMLELRDKGATIILSTHRMEQVEMMCDSICLIDHGHKVLDGELRAIKKSYGKNTVRIEFEGPEDFLNLPAVVASVNRHGTVVEAKLTPDGDAQEILRAAVARGVTISRFELIEPPLNDIFIEKVGRA